MLCRQQIASHAVSQRTLVLDRSRSSLNIQSVGRVCRKTPSPDERKVYDSSIEKNTPECGIKEVILGGFGGHPITSKYLKRPFWLMRSKVLVRSINAIYWVCPVPCNFYNIKFVSPVCHAVMKPHCV